ncbi:MAG TPA: hypothetical protein VLG38_01630, partial [Gammaproteobacteria bacterium]|nr:hypothetical protein [Gammaproteobacteria bacterium]
TSNASAPVEQRLEDINSHLRSADDLPANTPSPAFAPLMAATTTTTPTPTGDNAAQDLQQALINICVAKTAAAENGNTYNAQRAGDLLNVHVHKADVAIAPENRELSVGKQAEDGSCKATLRGSKLSWNLLLQGMIDSNRKSCAFAITNPTENNARAFIFALLDKPAAMQIKFGFRNEITGQILRYVLQATEMSDPESGQRYTNEQLDEVRKRLFPTIAAANTPSTVQANSNIYTARM